MKKIYLALSLLLTSLLFLPSIVSAIGNPIKISTSTDDVVFPQIAADSNGYLHVAWMEVTPDQSWSGNVINPGIFYSRWNGDTWSTPLKVSSNTLFAENPAVTIDSLNTLHLVWDEKLQSDGSWRVHYRTRTAGVWGLTETLPLVSGTTIDWSPKVATDTSNNPHVVFTANTENIRDSIYWTKKTLGVWSTPEFVSLNASLGTITDSQWADIRSDSSGNIHLVYWSWSQGIFYRRYDGTSWSTPTLITPIASSTVRYPRLTITSGGEVFIVWFQSDNSIRVRRTAGGVWQSEFTLATFATDSFWGYPIMSITSDSKQRVHAGWGERDAGNLIDLRFRSFDPATSTWGPVQDVDLDNNDADSPFVFPDKWDNQHFVWTEYNPVTTRWELYYRVAEGTIQTVGSSGGLIKANPNNTTYVTLNIPVNALTSNTQIGIQIGPVPESVDPLQITIPRAFTFRPHGLLFANNKVAAANIFYTDSEVVGVDERLLKAWLWNSLTNVWEARSTTNTPSQNKIAIDLTGFSLYGISGPIVNTTWLTPTSSQTVFSASYLVQFSLSYADGSSFLLPQSPDELMLLLKNTNGDAVKTLSYTNNNDGLRYDPGTNLFKALFHFRKDNIANGDYVLEVYLAGNVVGSQDFTLER